MTGLLDQFARAGRFRLPLLSRRAANTLAILPVGVGATMMFPALQLSPSLLILGLLIILSGLLLMSLTISEAQLRITRQLSGSHDLRTVPALTCVLAWPEQGVRHAAACALIRMLPRLCEANAVPLDRATRALLQRQLRRLNTERHQDLARVIQQALELPDRCDESKVVTGA